MKRLFAAFSGDPGFYRSFLGGAAFSSVRGDATAVSRSMTLKLWRARNYLLPAAPNAGLAPFPLSAPPTALAGPAEFAAFSFAFGAGSVAAGVPDAAVAAGAGVAGGFLALRREKTRRAPSSVLIFSP